MTATVDVRVNVPRGEIPEREADFLDWLGGPTVLRVSGRDPSRARVVAAMLHGNEPSGLRAVHTLLRAETPPAVNVVCFIGAVDAARAQPSFSNRVLAGRRDLNRCFRPPWDGVDGAIARSALAYLEQIEPEAVVDLHNNTGHNPPYAISAELTSAHLGLASVFTSRFIHSTLRLGSLMEAFRPGLPVVTIECGRAGTPEADAFARARVTAYAELSSIPESVGPGDMRMFVDPMRVTLRKGATVAFQDRHDPRAHVTLRHDVDRYNFEALAAGTCIGWVDASGPLPIEALDATGRDVAPMLFETKGSVLLTSCRMVPVMMTTNATVASMDCLFYVVRDANTRVYAWE